MPVCTANVETSHASRYLQQLCKHWSHKFAVDFDASRGVIPFNPETSLDLAADDKVLRITLHVAEAGNLERMQTVVDDHLKRFAFREELSIVWTAGPAAA